MQKLRDKDLRDALITLGVSRPYAHQLSSGARTPSFALAQKIERELGLAMSEWAEIGQKDHAA